MKNSGFQSRPPMPQIPGVSPSFQSAAMAAVSAAGNGSAGVMHSNGVAMFSPPQIEQLQAQIRQFKVLSKRYDLIKQSSAQEPQSQLLQSAIAQPRQQQSSSATHTVRTPSPQTAAASAAGGSAQSVKNEAQQEAAQKPAVKPNAYTLAVSSGVFYPGMQKGEPGMFPSPPWLLGPIDMKRQDAKPSRPFLFSLLEAKEKQLRVAAEEKSAEQDAAATSVEHDQLFLLQRRIRAKLAVSVAGSDGGSAAATTAVTLLNPHHFRRVRRPNRRDGKSVGRDQRKKVADREEARRRKHQSFLRALMKHNADFYRFHRAKRTDCAKTARNVKLAIESKQIAQEKEDDKAERRRLQALRENDIEAYTKLVQATKNERLQYLLKQTDEYIAEISRKVQMQRVEGRNEEEDMHAHAAAMRGMGMESSASAVVSRKYYQDTHQQMEEVRQPQMLVGGDLKEYQLAGLQWLVSLYNNNLNGILADEMGLGKTIQTIALLAYVMEFKHNNGPFLVIVPLSTLSNWVNEFNKWAPDMIRVVYKGTPAERKQLFKEEVEGGLFNVLLTTYEYVMKDKAMLRKLVWQYVIVDEGHRMKNSQSKFAETLGTLYQSRHRLLLTGTPLQNNLPELWSLLNFLLPRIFSSVETFDQWFNKPFASFRSGPGDQGDPDFLTNEERMLIIYRLHEVLRPFMLRRVKSMVMDQLPEKVEKVIRCELSGWQKQLYKRIQETGAAKVGPDGTASGSGLNNVIMQLRKVCNHPYLFLTEGWYIDDDIARCSGKFELLDRMLPKLKAAGHRVLLFSQMTQLMTVLEDFFKLRGFRYLRLDGSTSADEREQRMYMFNDPDSPYFVFLLSTRAGGLGLNLATADTVILFDSDWNPMMDAQAQDRAHRIGQKNEVRVFRLITTSPVEERILSRATDKLNLTGLVVEAGKFNKQSKAQERKEMMETLLKEWDEQDESEADENDVLDDEQLNEIMAVNEDELKLYQQMDSALDRRRRQAWIDRHVALGYTVEQVPPVQPRLMAENEIPGWLSNSGSAPLQLDEGESVEGATRDSFQQAPDQPPMEQDESNLSYPSRKRKEINYNEEPPEFEDLDNDASESVASEPAKPRKIKFVMSGLGDGVDVGGSSTGGGAGGGSSHDNMFEDFAQIIKGIRALKGEYGRPIYKIFAEKPSRQLFPDYYQLIAKPIALKDISRKIRERKYKSIEDFHADLELLCRNARTYNQETSIVYQDSERIREYVSEQIQLLQSGQPVKKPRN